MVDFSNVKEITIPEGNVKSISANGTTLWEYDSGGLPKEYQQVEYIQSSGSQYIETGIGGDAIGEYEIKFDALGSYAHEWEMYIAGTRTTTNYAGKIYCYSRNGNIVYQGYPVSGDLIIGRLSGGIYTIKVSIADGITSNGEYKTSYAGRSWGPSTFWIFNSHSESSLGSSMRLYYLIMYSDGVKVRDFIPCYRKSDDVIGLYDLVSGTFFTNSGTGNFTKGGNV